MEKRIIDLEIIDDLEGSGVDAIALVDSPAIEKNFMYFKAEEFVEPKSGESQDEYLGRCVPVLVGEGKDSDQAVAICISTYQNMALVNNTITCDVCGHSWDVVDGGQDVYVCHECGYDNQMDFAKVSFDWDDTLSTTRGKKLFEEHKKRGDELYIITARSTPGADIFKYANEMRIPLDRVFATGSNKAKIEKVKELNISKHIDNNPSVVASLFGIGEKFGIDTGGLAPYTNQSGPLKRKAVLGEEFAAESYPTIEEAVKRSEELGLKGEIHSHATDNGFIYMPGASHADLDKALTALEMSFASVDELSVGDAVSWKTADKNPRGRITEIVKGAKKVPGVDFEIQGSEEDPGYIIEIYEELDGKWEASGKYVGRKADSILKNVELAEDRTVGTYGFAKILFADEDKKEIVAIAMVPDMEIPRKDKDGNIYFVRFSKEVIAKIAEKYMREQRLADTNIQHVDTANAGAYVFESWIVETAEDKANSVYELDAPIGAWCVKMRVTNLETWAKVKSGELKGLSIQGDFLDKNEYEAYMKDRKMYSDLINLVKTL